MAVGEAGCVGRSGRRVDDGRAVDLVASGVELLVGDVESAAAQGRRRLRVPGDDETPVAEHGDPHLRLDVVVGAIFAILVAGFITIACAATLFVHGVPIETAGDAALALRPLAGNYASLLFAFGLLNASVFSAAVLPLFALPDVPVRSEAGGAFAQRQSQQPGHLTRSGRNI